MGMISEILAENEMKALAKVLHAAMDSHKHEIIDFCRKHIWPLYEGAASEAFVAVEPVLRQIYSTKECK